MIKFLKSFRNYGPGEIAGFSATQEAWLIEKKVAERFIAEKPKEAPVAKSSDAPKTEKGDGKPVSKQTTVGPQSR